MKRLLLTLTLLATFLSIVPASSAADAAPDPVRSVEERLEDIEAYINNGARNATTNAPSS